MIERRGSVVPIVAFLQDGYQASDIGRISKTDLYRDYGEWAKKNNIPPMSSMIAFNKLIIAQTVIPVIGCWISLRTGKQIEGWTGLMKNP